MGTFGDSLPYIEDRLQASCCAFQETKIIQRFALLEIGVRVPACTCPKELSTWHRDELMARYLVCKRKIMA